MATVRKLAKATAQWGEFEILVIPNVWGGLCAVAYRSNKRVYSSLPQPTQKAALASLRKRMRVAFDAIPRRVNLLEAEYERLRKALLR